MSKNTDPQFAIAIVSPAIQLHKLELPKTFVRDHGKHLSHVAYLQVLNGSDWPVEIVKHKGNLWLDRGWTHFVERYSIASGFILAFGYDGRSRFRVLIYDSTSLLITDSRSRPSLSVPMEESIEADSEGAEDNSTSCDEMLDGMEDQFAEAESPEGSADNRALQRANSFQSENPLFAAQISQRNLIGNLGPVLPTEHSRSYFKASDRHVILRVEHEKNWVVSCFRKKTQANYVALTSGWKEFVAENELKEGDACVFELVHVPTKTYDVHLFRISDRMDEPVIEEKVVQDEIPTKIPGKANAFIGRSPGFTLTMEKSYVNKRMAVRIPMKHAKKYLKKGGDDENVIVVHGKGGETWKLEYAYRSNYPWLSFGTWGKFRVDNRLKIGNVCAFKMIDVARKVYDVAIF